jgi:hypothetical protein
LPGIILFSPRSSAGYLLPTFLHCSLAADIFVKAAHRKYRVQHPSTLTTIFITGNWRVLKCEVRIAHRYNDWLRDGFPAEARDMSILHSVQSGSGDIQPLIQ